MLMNIFIKKKLIVLMVGLFIVGILTGCDNGGTPISSVYNDLYVNVYDSGGKPLEADSIILNKDDWNSAIYYADASSVSFQDLEDGKYTLIVGKEGYYAEIRRDFYLTSDTSRSIYMSSGTDLIEANIFVENEYGESLNNVVLTIRRGTTSKYRLDVNGNENVELTRGVVYDFTFEKDGYIGTTKHLYGTASDSYTAKLGEMNIEDKTVNDNIFESYQYKNVDLGYVDYNQTVVVGITALSDDPDDNWDIEGGISIDRSYYNINNNLSQALPADSEMASVGNKQMTESIYQIEEIDVNRDQARVDQIMRQREMDLRGTQLDVNRIKYRTQQEYVPQEGDRRVFYVDDFENGEVGEVTATLEEIGDHCLIYVDDNAQLSVSATDLFNMANSFDDKVFQIVIDYFATEDYSTLKYDWDQYPNLTILLTPMDDYADDGLIMGYFNPSDLPVMDPDNYSNQSDMIYLNSDALDFVDDSQYYYEMDHIYGTLAHEFQHLIFGMESLEVERNDVWINEGFSGLAEHLCGYYDYINDGRINLYFQDTAVESLLYWDDSESSLNDYGASNLFALYLYNKCGIDIIEDIMITSGDPIQVIDSNVDNYSHGIFENFNELFAGWIATNYVNNDLNGDITSQYIYYKANLDTIELDGRPIPEKLTYDYDYFTVKPGAVKYYVITGNGTDIDITVDMSEDTAITIYK